MEWNPYYKSQAECDCYERMMGKYFLVNKELGLTTASSKEEFYGFHVNSGAITGENSPSHHQTPRSLIGGNERVSASPILPRWFSTQRLTDPLWSRTLFLVVSLSRSRTFKNSCGLTPDPSWVKSPVPKEPKLFT
jgi:hypothetical protein